MKKKLLTALALTLCLLVLCCACGNKTTTDTPTPPDDTRDVSTSDNTQNVTPPDTTADDNKTSNEPAPPADPDPTPPAQDDPTPPVQDDPAQPDDAPAVDYFAAFDISKYDYSTNEENLKAVQAYYDFLFNNTEAYNMNTSKQMSFVDMAEDAKPISSFWMNIQNLKLAFVDFGVDGVLEMVFDDGNNSFKYWVILFYENDQLYLDTVNHRSMGQIRKNGFNRYEAFQSTSFSAEGGQSDVSLFVCSTSKEFPYDKKYYTYFEIVNGEFVQTERTEITEAEYQSLLDAYYKVPGAVWYSVTDTYESILWNDIDHLMIFADINNQPSTMYNPK